MDQSAIPSRTSRNASQPQEGSSTNSAATLLESVAPQSDGLTSAEAAARLRRDGANGLLSQQHSSHPLVILFSQFRSPLVLILLAAAALTYALGELDEALIITAIVAVSSGLGFYQEYRASAAFDALQDRLRVMVTVRRDGVSRQVPMSDVAAGDLLILAAGSIIPADCLVKRATALLADEATLTGESFPVSKAAIGTDLTLPPAETNWVRMGTSVRSGAGEAIVVFRGAQTEFGAIAASLGRLEPETSFARGVRSFGRLMTQIMLVMVALIFPLNIIMGRPLLESLLFSAALAVGMTPELLPAIVTVTLARGAQRLAKVGVLVRRLVAIENLGAMNVLCTDKTGTLTEGAVRLASACDTSGASSSETLRWAFANASLQAGLPNPLDTAVVEAGRQAGLERFRKLDEIPYDFERKRLSILLETPEGPVLACKGAVDQVLAVCGSIVEDGATMSLSDDLRERERNRLKAWSEQGYRVLALATKPHLGGTCSLGDELDLTLLGYLLFFDPLKPAIAETVSALKSHGIALKIITGDNRYVAAHTAGEIGLAHGQVLVGAEIAGMNDRMLLRRAAKASVFAEITPEQKERIILALRHTKHTVGYLGDGINDAPALRAADIGISVDSAVDAAKESADIVLLQRDLGVLLDGILIGRTAFANTLKYIAITTSANLGNMISMAVISLFLPFLPMLAKQILLNNLLSDLPMMAISTDRVDQDVLTRPGRWDFARLLRTMVAFGLASSAFDALTFAVLLGGFHSGEATFQTSWFLVSLLTELAVVGVMRTRRRFYESLPSPLLLWLSAAVAGAAICLPYAPFSGLLGFVPLAWPILVSLLGIALAYTLVSELLKARLASLARLMGKWLRPSRRSLPKG